MVAYRHWCNKLWNAIKFAMKNLGDGFRPSAAADAQQLPLACRWLLSRLSATTASVTAAMEAYEFGSATQVPYQYFAPTCRSASIISRLKLESRAGHMMSLFSPDETIHVERTGVRGVYGTLRRCQCCARGRSHGRTHKGHGTGRARQH